MSEARPQLVAVDGDSVPREATEGPGPEAGRAPSSLGRYGWIAAALAVVCVIGWGVTANRASRLEAELTSSQAALAAAEGRIEGYRTHLLQVRERTGTLVHGMEALVGQIGSLASELESLGSLVGEDPTATGRDETEAAAQP
ncbi:MAG: hypothetical protein GY946_16145 [bacterium]|nr:hypothetical protein [bacterium]